MRVILSAIVVASVVTLCPASSWAQAKAQAPKQFGGLTGGSPEPEKGSKPTSPSESIPIV